MKLKTLLTANAVVSAVYGVAFAVAPMWLFDLFGVDSTAELEYMGRLFGAALIGFGLVAWFAKDAADSQARQAIVKGYFGGYVLGFIMALIGQLDGVVNGLGWSTVAIYLFFAADYGYILYKKAE